MILPKEGDLDVLPLGPEVFHVVIDEPICAKCNNMMDARILHAPDVGKIPVFHCRCCKRVHKVTHPEFLDWMACTKLCSPNLQFVADVEEGKVYRV